MAAKRLQPGERLLDLLAAEDAGLGDLEAYSVRSHRAGDVPEDGVLTDAPPAAFTERVRGDAGEVRVSPLVDRVFQRLRERREAPPGPGP